MNKKKKCLRRKGWTVGDAKDFLGLSDEEEAYIELKLALSRKLRQRRARKKLTQMQLARMIKSSQSRVAKMEAGDPTVSLDLLIRSLLVLGTSKTEFARVISASHLTDGKNNLKNFRRKRAMIKLKDLHLHYIANEAGEKTSVILSMEDFRELLEDIEDLATVAERRDEPTIPHEKLVAELKRDGLI
jgi:transcriptional regulator with XRE-family HTH domain